MRLARGFNIVFHGLVTCYIDAVRVPKLRIRQKMFLEAKKLFLS